MRRAFVPILILGLGFLAVWFMPTNSPVIDIEPDEVTSPAVSVIEAKPENLKLSITAYGMVTPKSEIDLVAEVSGKVTFASPSFVAGGFFSKGDLLLSIDRRDFELAVTRAEAAVAEARQFLIREQAEADLAAEEWQAIGRGQDANPLVLRKPQLEEARAKLKAAEADLSLTRLELERTDLFAPFDGRLRSKTVTTGSYVSAGESLARLYATDVVEVRLPLDDRQLRYLNLPFGQQVGDHVNKRPRVEISAVFAGRRHQWIGRIVRSEGIIDTESRVLYAIAEIDRSKQAKTDAGQIPPAIGMFVEATIKSGLFENVYALPASALGQPDTVLVVDDDHVLQSRTVGILKRYADRIVISEGLHPGDRVVVDQHANMLAGMTVRVEAHAMPSNVARAEP